MLGQSVGSNSLCLLLLLTRWGGLSSSKRTAEKQIPVPVDTFRRQLRGSNTSGPHPCACQHFLHATILSISTRPSRASGRGATQRTLAGIERPQNTPTLQTPMPSARHSANKKNMQNPCLSRWREAAGSAPNLACASRVGPGHSEPSTSQRRPASAGFGQALLCCCLTPARGFPGQQLSAFKATECVPMFHGCCRRAWESPRPKRPVSRMPSRARRTPRAAK